MRFARRLAVSLVVAATVSALLAAPAAAAVNVNVGCGGARVHALSRAINQANQRSATTLTTITLTPNCTYTLHRVRSNGLYGQAGLPAVIRHIAIEGHGSTIMRGASAPQFRLLTVGQTGWLQLYDLTLQNGHALDGANGTTVSNGTGGNGSAGQNGGAIYNDGKLALDSVTFDGNRAGDGGDGGDSTGENGANGIDNGAGAGSAGEPGSAASGALEQAVREGD